VDTIYRQTSTQAVSLVPIQGSAITYAIAALLRVLSAIKLSQESVSNQIEKNGLYHQTGLSTSRISTLQNYNTSGSRSPGSLPAEFEPGDGASYNNADSPGNAKSEVVPMLRTSGNRITWMGHNTLQITTSNGKIILIDPWVEEIHRFPPRSRASHVST